jgi:hypothetical protein
MRVNGVGDLTKPYERYIFSEKGVECLPICELPQSGVKFSGVQKANAERIIACVNACEGMSKKEIANIPDYMEIIKLILEIGEYSFKKNKEDK